jgi:cellulose synthase (UDP-forming)
MSEWLIGSILIIFVALCSIILVRLFTRKAGQNGQSKNGHTKQLSEKGILAVTVIAAAFTLYYLIWRLSTFNPDAIAFSWLLWLAEAYGLMVFVLHAFITWRLVYPTPPQPNRSFTVDVFIPTYNEPVDVLRATLSGCAEIRYPHQTYILDDGAREEVQALAADFNCGYIARPTRKGAKAGNLNHALCWTKGELIATLDADNIPLPNFLDEAIGFFNDPAVAVVQGPELFYNVDSFEHEGSDWHEQKLFFHVILPGKNRTNSAFWCGSPAVLRRSAIESIGGVAEETVTEDLHTSIRLARHGYRLVYVDRPMAVGLAPATARDFLVQRFRWAQGAMQTFRIDNPLAGRGLTFRQRLSFFASMETYFDAIQKLVLLAIPIIVLFTGALPINTLAWPFWLRFTPYMILTFSALWLLGRGIYNIWDVLRYDTVKMFTFITALPTLITGRARPFQVTSKVAGNGNRSLFQRLVIPHWIVMGLSFAAIAVGVANLIHPIWYQPALFPTLMAIGWASFDLALVTSGVMLLRKVSRRATYRFPASTDSYWQVIGKKSWYPARSVDFSATGIGLENSGPHLRLGDRVKLIIANKLDTGEMSNRKGQGLIPFNKEAIVLTAQVASEYNGKYNGNGKHNGNGNGNGKHDGNGNGKQRVGLKIQQFASYSDMATYFGIVYSPCRLLNGHHEEYKQLVPVGNK